MRHVHSTAHFELSCELVTFAVDALKGTRFSQNYFNSLNVKDFVDKQYQQSTQSTDFIIDNDNDLQVVAEETHFLQRFKM